MKASRLVFIVVGISLIACEGNNSDTTDFTSTLGEEACIDSGFAWFSDVCCSPPISPEAEDTPDCDEISHCREPCSTDDDCTDAARPFCCPEWVCPSNEDYSVPACSMRSCVEEDCSGLCDDN